MRDLFSMEKPSNGRVESLGKSVGEKLKQLRLQRDMTQEELSDGILSKSYISALELGKLQPSLRALQQLADKLGTPLSYFMEGTRNINEKMALALARLHLQLATPDSVEPLKLLEHIRELAKTPLETRYHAEVLYLEGIVMQLVQKELEAVTKLEASINLWERAQDWDWVAKTRCMQAKIYIKRSEWVHARNYLEKALHLIQNNSVFEPLLKLEIYSQLSSVYLPLGANADMEKLQQDSRELLQKLGDPYQHNNLFEQASELYEQAGNYEKAREILYHNLGFQQEQKLTGSIRKLYYNFGVTAQNENKPLEAIENFQKALNAVANSTAEPIINRTYNNLAQLYLDQGELSLARETALKALVQSTDDPSPLELGRTHVTLGRISEKLGEHEQADSYFQAAFEQYALVNHSQELADAYYSYAQILSDRGSDQVSIDYLQKAYSVLSSMDKVIRPYLR